jgi:hypothetical protein
MKHTFHFWSHVLALVVLIAPNAYATVGTVHNGALNDADVNRDGNITAVDVTALYDYLLGTGDESGTFNYDVNGDGSVNVADITMVYGVMLNWQPYNSIFDAFNMSFTNYLNREYYKFSWDDVTQSYDVTNPDYLLVIGTDENFSKYDCWHISDNSTTMGKQTISEWLRNIYHWTSPSDVPNTVNLVARVEVMLDNGSDVIISNERSFLHFPQFTFESSQPIHLWWLVGSFVGASPWSNSIYSNGLVPMYPVQGATYNENGEGPLEYYGYFPTGGEFKIIEEPGSWDKVIGGGNENGGQVYSENVADYPDNIIINQGGYYKIELNTVTKTMTMTRLSDNQASYGTITMPGYYNGWDVSSNSMTALNTNNNHDWTTYLVLDNDSELKFAPGSWDYDWGANQFPYGKGYQGGYNIPAKQGGYNVYFNDMSGDYMFLDSDGLPSSNYLKITNTVNELINLSSDYPEGTKLQICNISTDLDGPYQLRFDSRSVTIDQDGKVDINELKEAVFSTYDRPRTGGCILYCWVEAQSGPQTVKSNTISVPVQIENYSIVIEGSSTTIEMTPSSLNTFKAIIPSTGSDIRFRIAPESSSAEIDMITPFSDSDVTATNGTIGFGMQGYFKIPYNPLYSEYEVLIDLGYKTYTIEGHDTSSKIWQVGNANNWGNPANGLLLNNEGVYVGYMFLNTYFRFRENESSWDGVSWGAGSSSGTLAVNGDLLYTPQGFYKVDVNLDYMAYNLTELSSVSIIGSAVPTGTQWATDVDLTYNQGTGAWETYMVLNKGEFKFRANHDWTLNWGGTLDSIVDWGANLSVGSPGPYRVQFFLTYNGNSHAVLTRQ